VQVCNHPDLFEGRPIISAFDMWGLELRLPSAAARVRMNTLLCSPPRGSLNADPLYETPILCWPGVRAAADAAAGPGRSRVLKVSTCKS